MVSPAPLKPQIAVADVEKIDVRVGTIVTVEDVPNAARLPRLTVDFGDHRCTILAGIRKERTNPREIEGRAALFGLNLPPRPLAGEVSDGVIVYIALEGAVTPLVSVSK